MYLLGTNCDPICVILLNNMISLVGITITITITVTINYITYLYVEMH